MCIGVRGKMNRGQITKYRRRCTIDYMQRGSMKTTGKKDRPWHRVVYKVIHCFENCAICFHCTLKTNFPLQKKVCLVIILGGLGWEMYEKKNRKENLGYVYMFICVIFENDVYIFQTYFSYTYSDHMVSYLQVE